MNDQTLRPMTDQKQHPHDDGTRGFFTRAQTSQQSRQAKAENQRHQPHKTKQLEGEGLVKVSPVDQFQNGERQQ